MSGNIAYPGCCAAIPFFHCPNTGSYAAIRSRGESPFPVPAHMRPEGRRGRYPCSCRTAPAHGRKYAYSADRSSGNR